MSQPNSPPAEMPELSPFSQITMMLGSMALQHMGAFPDEQGHRYVQPEAAQAMIDMLDVLAQKTRGNLDKEEDKLLSETLHSLRLQFVQILKMIEQGEIKTTPMPGAEAEAPAAPAAAPAAPPPAAEPPKAAPAAQPEEKKPAGGEEAAPRFHKKYD